MKKNKTKGVLWIILPFINLFLLLTILGIFRVIQNINGFSEGSQFISFLFPILITLSVLFIPVGLGIGIYFLKKKDHLNINLNEEKLDRTKYAGFWKRFLAYILDSLIIFIPLVILNIIVGEDFGNLVSILAVWLYYALMESSEKQATLGKMALGIKITNIHGKKISFAQATGRHFAKFISGITLGIGYIIIGITEKKQGLHDIIASTLVVVNSQK